MNGTAGHELVGLENGHLLDRDLGDGSTRVWQVVSKAGASTDIQLVANLAGASRDELRRGHRLVPLGPARLLEWLPRPCDARAAPGGICLGADYRVWSYSFEAGADARDPIDAAPVSSGSWSGIGPGDDIVADDANLFVWTRKDGRLRSYPLDPTAIESDPPRRLSEVTKEALRSSDWNPPTTSPEIKHVVVILQDGRSFDSYFGQYCQFESSAGESPQCESGPGCCEAMPEAIDGAASCASIGSAADTNTDGHVPKADPACMRAKIANGHMSGFVAGPPRGTCGDPLDFACAGPDPAAGTPADYWRLLPTSALADNFFQSYAYADGPGGAGAGIPTIENLLYLVTARYTDNDVLADKSVLADKPLLTKELARVQVPWAVYAGPSNLPLLSGYGRPIFYDPNWYPFRSLAAGELEHDVDNGELPSVAVVLPDDGDRATSESPGHAPGPAITYVAGLLGKIAGSPLYKRDTLVLLTYLTAGGYYDHVPPPAARDLTIDGSSSIPAQSGAVAYGPRVPLLAFPPFAQANHISHESLEMSSITVFIEWNWLHGNALKGSRESADRRAYRDTVVNNLGSLIDPVAAGVEVPIHRD
jgi:phospholipase C